MNVDAAVVISGASAVSYRSTELMNNYRNVVNDEVCLLQLRSIRNFGARRENFGEKLEATRRVEFREELRVEATSLSVFDSHRVGEMSKVQSLVRRTRATSNFSQTRRASAELFAIVPRIVVPRSGMTLSKLLASRRDETSRAIDRFAFFSRRSRDVGSRGTPNPVCRYPRSRRTNGGAHLPSCTSKT